MGRKWNEHLMLPPTFGRGLVFVASSVWERASVPGWCPHGLHAVHGSAVVAMEEGFHHRCVCVCVCVDEQPYRHACVAYRRDKLCSIATLLVAMGLGSFQGGDADGRQSQ